MTTNNTLRRTANLPRLSETVAILSEQLHTTLARSLREAAGIVSAPMTETITCQAVAS